jgi:basic amino acid/polyamine antiporter, APA family
MQWERDRVSAGSQAAPPGLVREVRRWDLVALMINSIIGVGIFGLPSQIYSLTGAYSLFAFVACAAVVLIVAVCYAEVASRFSATGGPYLYAHESFGPLIGFEVGWLAFLARVSTIAFGCNVLVSYAGFFAPAVTTGAWRIAVMAVVVGLLALANIAGVGRGAKVSDFFTVGKLVPMTLFIAAGLFFIDPQRFALTGAPSVSSFSLGVSQLIYAFTGFELGSIAAGEAREPQRNMPFAILIAIGVVVVLYILIQVVCIGTVPNLGASQRPLADASRVFLGRAGASIITAGVLTSAIGNLSAIILSGSRLPFAMAEAKQLPRIFATVHPKFHTPQTAILTTAGLGLLLGWSGTFRYTLSIGAITKLATFIASSAALIILRRRKAAPEAIFRVAGGPVLAVIAMLLCVWLLFNSGWRELRDVGLAAVAGFVVLQASKPKRAGYSEGFIATNRR